MDSKFSPITRAQAAGAKWASGWDWNWVTVPAPSTPDDVLSLDDNEPLLLDDGEPLALDGA